MSEVSPYLSEEEALQFIISHSGKAMKWVRRLAPSNG
jgi:hypothetical protein